MTDLERENKELRDQISYQQSVIRTQHETINELQRYREAVDDIASVCDLVLCGATNWDEEQLDEHFEHVYQIVKWSRKEPKEDETENNITIEVVIEDKKEVTK